MPFVIEPGLDAPTFCARLRQYIKAVGIDAAFGLGDFVIVYSGPAQYVRDQITTSFTGNWAKSRDQAATNSGRRIDDTSVGQDLAGCDLQTYFRGFYGKNDQAIDDAETEVWGCASVEFMRAKFKKMASAVCGASPVRVFRKHELGSLVKNRRLRIINSRPAQMFREFYKLHADEAFKLFCLTELLEARQKAKAEGSKEAWTDYRERRQFFILAQKYERDNFPALPEPQRITIKVARRNILATYNLANLGLQKPRRQSKPRRASLLKSGLGTP